MDSIIDAMRILRFPPAFVVLCSLVSCSTTHTNNPIVEEAKVAWDTAFGEYLRSMERSTDSAQARFEHEHWSSYSYPPFSLSVLGAEFGPLVSKAKVQTIARRTAVYDSMIGGSDSTTVLLRSTLSIEQEKRQIDVYGNKKGDRWQFWSPLSVMSQTWESRTSRVANYLAPKPDETVAEVENSAILDKLSTDCSCEAPRLFWKFILIPKYVGLDSALGISPCNVDAVTRHREGITVVESVPSTLLREIVKLCCISNSDADDMAYAKYISSQISGGLDYCELRSAIGRSPKPIGEFLSLGQAWPSSLGAALFPYFESKLGRGQANELRSLGLEVGSLPTAAQQFLRLGEEDLVREVEDFIRLQCAQKEEDQ